MSSLSKYSKKLALCLTLFLAFCCLAVSADTITYPFPSFVNGTIADGPQVTQNFAAVSNVVNGNLTNSNIKAGAAIAASKIDFSSGFSGSGEIFVKRLATNRCLSAGTTGDTVPRVTLNTDGTIGFGPGGAAAIDCGIMRHTFGGSTLAAWAGTPAIASGIFGLQYQVGTDTTTGNYSAQLASEANNGYIEFGNSAGVPDVRLKRTSAGVLSVQTTGGAGGGNINFGSAATLSGNSIVSGIMPGGRLCLTTNTPVTGDVTGAGTLFYTPYKGNVYPAYTTASGVYTTKNFTEASLSLTGLVSAGINYDVFGVYTSGTTPVLSLVAWASDTVRATSLTRSAISGLLYKTGDEQSLYLGTIRGSGANVTAKSRAAGQLYVWNMYNRVVEDAQAQDTTDSWTYTLVAYQEQRAQTTEGTSRIGILRGLDEDSIEVQYNAAITNPSTGAAVQSSVGIGVDSSTVNSAHNMPVASTVASCIVPLTATYKGKPGLGYHTLRALEQSVATGTCTHYGDNGGTVFQTGMRLMMLMFINPFRSLCFVR